MSKNNAVWEGDNLSRNQTSRNKMFSQFWWIAVATTLI